MLTHTAISYTDITLTLSHWYEIYLYHHYMDTLVHWTWYYMLHSPLLLHVIVIHGYATRIIATRICYTDTWIWYTDTRIFTGIHALIICVCVCVYSCYMYIPSCNPVIWLCPATFIDILVTRHECCWYVMCGTKCHVDLSNGGHSRIPYLRYIAFCYLVSWYQQSSRTIIVLLVPCIVLIFDILCRSIKRI